MADNSAAQIDLDETLNKTLEEIESRETTEEEPEEPKEPETQEPEEEEPKEPEDEEPEESPEEEPEEPEEEPKEEPKESEKEAKRPPGSWSPKGKEEFAKLPEHIQDEVLKREADFHKGIEQYKEKAEYADRISRVVQPYEPLIRAKNSTPEKVVQNMLNTAYQLESGNPQQKAQLLIQAAQQYGADMDALRQALDPNNQQQPDPYVQRLEQELHDLKNNVYTQQATAQQQSAVEINQSIESFRSELDESGNLKHLYFDDVRDDMADLMEAAERGGKKLTLQDAYDAAIWARSDIRESLLAKQQEEAEAKRKREAQQKAQQAKKKAKSNVSTSGSHSQSSDSQLGSIDDTLRETMKEIESRED